MPLAGASRPSFSYASPSSLLAVPETTRARSHSSTSHTRPTHPHQIPYAFPPIPRPRIDGVRPAHIRSCSRIRALPTVHESVPAPAPPLPPTLQKTQASDPLHHWPTATSTLPFSRVRTSGVVMPVRACARNAPRTTSEPHAATRNSRRRRMTVCEAESNLGMRGESEENDSVLAICRTRHDAQAAVKTLNSPAGRVPWLPFLRFGHSKNNSI